MKVISRGSGPFSERIYYDESEIDLICVSELQRVKLFPPEPGPIRIESFIEKRFGITPSYSDELPPGILGYTIFSADGPTEMAISRVLVETTDRVSERRVNTTLAHEAGHCLLHTCLFALQDGSALLFSDDEPESRILCREGEIGPDRREYGGRWWEYQANMVIGALLLPKRLVTTCIDEFLLRQGELSAAVLPNRNREQAVQLLSHMFDVNPTVARIRLQKMYPLSDETQLTL